jgi:hypothetical protein
MKFTSLIPFLTVLIVCAAGCSSSDYSDETAASASAPNVEAPQGSQISKLTSRNQFQMNRNVVKEGSLAVQVDDIVAAEKRARRIAESLRGRIDKVNSTDLASPSASLQMTLRMPVSRFESAIEQLESLGNRLGKQIAVDDVTEQIVDMDARVKTMLAQEEVLRNMLRKSGNLADALTVQNELARLRGEIESIAAKRKSLASQAAFSTLELTLTQKSTAIAHASTDPAWFETSWASAWGAGTAAFRSVVGYVMWLVVFSPVWILAVLLVRHLVRWANSSGSSSAGGEASPRV